MQRDRRRRRALSPLLAAEHYLDCARERSQAAQVLLLEAGEIVATSSHGQPDTEGYLTTVRAALSGEAPSHDVYLHPLVVDGRPLCLASVGRRVLSVRDAAAAMSRIFAG